MISPLYKYPAIVPDELAVGANVEFLTEQLMILLLVIHLVGSNTHFQPQVLHAVLHPIFFAVALVHFAVSASKAFITLGIGTAKLVKVVDVLMAILCGTIFVASVVGFYLCLFIGVVK